MRRAKLNVMGLAEIRWMEDERDFIKEEVRIVHTG